VQHTQQQAAAIMKDKDIDFLIVKYLQSKKWVAGLWCAPWPQLHESVRTRAHAADRAAA
jgi:adenine-specific DNA glycosylase